MFEHEGQARRLSSSEASLTHLDGDSAANGVLENRLRLSLRFVRQFVLLFAHLALLRAVAVLLLAQFVLLRGQFILLAHELLIVRGWLFVTQRLDRIELGGARRGIDAARQSDGD